MMNDERWYDGTVVGGLACVECIMYSIRSHFSSVGVQTGYFCTMQGGCCFFFDLRNEDITFSSGK